MTTEERRQQDREKQVRRMAVSISEIIRLYSPGFLDRDTNYESMLRMIESSIDLAWTLGKADYQKEVKSFL